MGWISFDKPRDVHAYLKSDYTYESPSHAYRVLRSAFVGRNVWYAAVEHTDKTRGKVNVFAAVTLIHYYDKGETISLKQIDESMGPTECKCPKTILALLTPLREGTGHYAKGWRAKCEAYHANRTRPVSDTDVAAWAGTYGACFANFSKGYKIKWRNAYRRKHPAPVAEPESVLA